MPTLSAPRNAKILPRSPGATFTTGCSWSHGLSGHAPGSERQNSCRRVTSMPCTVGAVLVGSATMTGERTRATGLALVLTVTVVASAVFELLGVPSAVMFGSLLG